MSRMTWAFFRPLRHAPPIDDGRAQRQFGCGLDFHIAVTPRKELRLQKPGDDTRVVQRPAIRNRIFPRRSAPKKSSSSAAAAPTFVPMARNASTRARVVSAFVGDVERHHHDRNACGKHGRRGMGSTNMLNSAEGVTLPCSK